MARVNSGDWIPAPIDSQIISQIANLSAAESRLRKVNMTSDIQKVPRISDTKVTPVQKGAEYVDNGGDLDNVTLEAIKFGAMTEVDWEDLQDSSADVINAFLSEWASEYARLIDNAVFAVSGAVNSDTVPFTSVYATAKDGGNFSETNGALTYDVLSDALGAYEESHHYDEANSFIVASTAVKAGLRSIKDANDRPIFVESMAPAQPSTLFGLPIVFNGGLRTSATATATPSGNPLIVIGNSQRGLFGDRSGVESKISEEHGFSSDGVALKVRRRAGFAVAEPTAFSVVELTA